MEITADTRDFDSLDTEIEDLRAEVWALKTLLARARPLVRRYAKDDLYVAILNAVSEEDDDAIFGDGDAP